MNTDTLRTYPPSSRTGISRWLMAALLLLTGPGAFAQLSGTYTINSAQPTGGTNYTSFTAATAALNAGGVSGPVAFTVSGGPYTEQIVLNQLTGSSATNRVTFHGNGRTIRFGSSTSTQRAVILLNGADYVTLDSLNIDATNAGAPGTYGWGLHLTNQADNNIVRGCTVTSSETSTSSNFAGIVVSGSATGATTGGNNANNLLLERNTVVGGYYGITLLGTSTTVRGTGNLLRGNTVRDFYYYGVYAAYQTDAQYVRNDINRATRAAVSTFYGLYVYYNLGGRIEGNRIHDGFTGGTATGTAYPLYVYYSDGTAAAPILVLNNQVYNLGNAGLTYGIYNYYSDYVSYYHNTVALNSTAAGTTLRAYSQYAATGTNLRNNIFTVTQSANATAYAIYIYYASATPPTLVSNYNDLYVTPAANAYLGYYGTATTATTGGAATLTAWRAVNGSAFGQNSVALDPRFRTATDLRPTNVGLNNTGTPATLATTPTDFAGVTRNNPPDMGAYEFTPTANEVQLVSIDSPTSPAMPGNNTVTVTIRNGGTAVLTSVALSYALNTGTSVAQSFTGLTLATGTTQQLTFATSVIPPSGTNSLSVTVSLPSGQPDTDLTDNTLTTTFDQPTPGNDEPCAALALGTAPLTSSNSGASTSIQAGITLPACSPSQLPSDVWFTLTPSGTSTTLTLTGAPAGMVRVFTSASCSAGPFTQVFCASSGVANTAVGSVTVPGLTPGTRYYVAVSGYGSSDTDGQFTIVATALLGNKAQVNSAALVVFPNPSTTGQLTLQVARPLGTGTVELLNALGQVVKRQPLAATPEQTVTTTGLAAGLYTLRVQAGAEVLTRKVVLQ